MHIIKHADLKSTAQDLHAQPYETAPLGFHGRVPTLPPPLTHPVVITVLVLASSSPSPLVHPPVSQSSAVAQEGPACPQDCCPLATPALSCFPPKYHFLGYKYSCFYVHMEAKRQYPVSSSATLHLYVLMQSVLLNLSFINSARLLGQ